MKAAQLTQYGGKEAITIVQIPKPIISKDKILVEVRAAGVNPFDWKIQRGYLKDYIPLQLPVTLGGDFAGIILEVGDGVSEFKVGDDVYGQANILAGGSGSFAEFALTKPSVIARKPKKLNFIEAGSLPLAGVSAYMALIEHMKFQKGPASAQASAGKQKILIHGGAGGIGTIAIQIAKYLGAYVATTVNEEDIDYVKKLGADVVIDYNKQKFEDVITDYDTILDNVGGETTNRSIEVLKNGGILVSMLQKADEALTKGKNITAIAQQSQITTARLNKLTEFVDSGVISAHIEKAFRLDETGDALEYLKDTPPKGKVVIEMK